MQEPQTTEDGQRMLLESDAVSWWRWRPGARPLRAFLLGGLLSLLALFLLLNALAALLAAALDGSSAPLQVPGIVSGQNNRAAGSPLLTIRLARPGLPASITLAVPPSAVADLPNGSPVVLDYAPHQDTPYALESHGQRYELPGSSASGNLLETLGLLLCGLLLLPYPLLLATWGWRDLRVCQNCQRSGHIVALRAARQTTTRTPGMVPRTTHIWYGVAIQAEHPSPGLDREILIFSVRQDVYSSCKRGDYVHVTYSPSLHHLYTITRL
ncbi:MAG TPA: hypothetical protein VGF67_00630 [Ktedonobacteraceae bacterium]